MAAGTGELGRVAWAQCGIRSQPDALGLRHRGVMYCGGVRQFGRKVACRRGVYGF